MSACETADCHEPAAELMVIYDVPRELCRHHAAVAEVWLWVTAADLDPRPHESRPCALCHTGERAPGRAVCEPCRDRAYAVHAAGANR